MIGLAGRPESSVVSLVAGDDGIGGRGGGRSVALWVIEAWGGSWAGNVAVTRCGWRRVVESDSLGCNCGSVCRGIILWIMWCGSCIFKKNSISGI